MARQRENQKVGKLNTNNKGTKIRKYEDQSDLNDCCLSQGNALV